MKGALPPSSSDTFFTCPAHWRISSLPTSVEPVKPSLRTIGLEVSSPPIAGASSASPVTIERTPGGSPAPSARTATASAESGVCSAGFSTIVQPAASAGADFRVGIAAGKFQGVIPAVTPTASFVTTIRLSGHGVGVGAPSARFASPGPPPTALFVSPAPMGGTSATTSPVAGLSTANVAPESASTHVPPTYAWRRRRSLSTVAMRETIVDALADARSFSRAAPTPPRRRLPGARGLPVEQPTQFRHVSPAPNGHDAGLSPEIPDRVVPRDTRPRRRLPAARGLPVEQPTQFRHLSLA